MRKLAMQCKAVWMWAFLLLGLPAMSFAGGSTCAAATGLVPDGRVLSLDYVQPGGTVWYSFGSSSGHSYSVEVRDDLDGNPGGELSFTFYSANCATQMSGASGPPYSANQYRDTSAIEPKVIPNTGMRVSIPNPNSDTIAIKVVNTSTTIGHYVSASVSDTTLYSTSWSDYSGYNGYFSLVNTTSSPISYTVTLISTFSGSSKTAPTQVASASGTVAAADQVALNTATGPLAVATQQGGYALLTQDGPPQAISALSAEAVFDTTSPYVGSLSYFPFVAAREKR